MYTFGGDPYTSLEAKISFERNDGGEWVGGKEEHILADFILRVFEPKISWRISRPTGRTVSGAQLARARGPSPIELSVWPLLR